MKSKFYQILDSIDKFFLDPKSFFCGYQKINENQIYFNTGIVMENPVYSIKMPEKLSLQQFDSEFSKLFLWNFCPKNGSIFKIEQMISEIYKFNYDRSQDMNTIYYKIEKNLNRIENYISYDGVKGSENFRNFIVFIVFFAFIFSIYHTIGFNVIAFILTGILSLLIVKFGIIEMLFKSIFVILEPLFNRTNFLSLRKKEILKEELFLLREFNNEQRINHLVANSKDFENLIDENLIKLVDEFLFIFDTTLEPIIKKLINYSEHDKNRIKLELASVVGFDLNRVLSGNGKNKDVSYYINSRPDTRKNSIQHKVEYFLNQIKIRAEKKYFS
ncbi:MAG: hypothetical protein SFY32_16695 [Bacteroidota bacterium]|nr:hypothetical protein [Bacteroidota bacterium]